MPVPPPTAVLVEPFVVTDPIRVGEEPKQPDFTAISPAVPDEQEPDFTGISSAVPDETEPDASGTLPALPDENARARLRCRLARTGKRLSSGRG